MDSYEEEEKLVEMVYAFIESRPPSPVGSNSKPSLDDHPTYLSLQKTLKNVTDDERAVLNKVTMFLEKMGFERKRASLMKWLVKKLKKDGFDASIGKNENRWVSTSGKYEYIEIKMKDDKKKNESARLIADLDFNSQFEIARPTPTYTHILGALPSLFVGTEEKMRDTVSILCSAAKQSLLERGLHIPPWRTASYMQSKWIPVPAAESQTKLLLVTAKDDKDGEDTTNWLPITISPKRKAFGGGSALTRQFSNMGINCC